MQLIAHRGASGHAPENTMAAFKLALEMGATAIELDVHQTKDEELAVIHDFDLRRVGRSRARVKNLAWDQLSTHDVGSWFAPGFKDERVSRLSEVMALADGKTELHIELKKGSSLYPGIEGRVLKLIESRGAWDKAVISSFDHGALRRARSLSARARIGYLRGMTPMALAFREMKKLGCESLHISQRQANRRVVRLAHERGLKVLVYTVNAQKDIMRLKELGVDGVFTNFPELKA